jgi:hypothetical protein
MTAPSPRCRRATLCSDWHDIDSSRKLVGDSRMEKPRCFFFLLPWPSLHIFHFFGIRRRVTWVDSRMETAIGPRSRCACPKFPTSHSFRAAIFLCRNGALLFIKMFRYFGSTVSLVHWFGASVLALFAPNRIKQVPQERLRSLTGE